MQGQRSTVQFFPEAFDFDHASSSSSSAIDQQAHWNDVLNPGDAQTMPEYLPSQPEANMSYRNMFSLETENLSDWNLGNSSSSEPIMNRDRLDVSDLENAWASSSIANSGVNRFEERRSGAANVLSLDSMVTDLNNNEIAQGQSFLQNSSSSSPFNLDCNMGIVGNGSQVSQSGSGPFHSPLPLGVEQISASGSSNSFGITTADGVGCLSEDSDGRPESLWDGRRLSGKRKNIGGVPGPSSGSSSNICFQQTENSLLHNTVPGRSTSSGSSNIYFNDLSSVHHAQEHLNPRFIDGTRGVVSSVAGSAESSQRNFRLRMNPAHQADPSIFNLWPVGNSSMSHSVWTSQQSSSLLIPVIQPLEARPVMPSTSSQSQSHLPTIPGMPRVVHPFSWNGTSRVSTSTNSHTISNDRLATLREEASLRVLQRNGTLEHQMFVPAAEVGHLSHDHVNWNLANGNVSIPRNMASTSLAGSTPGVHPSINPTWNLHRSSPGQYQHTLSEFGHRPFPVATSDPPGQLTQFNTFLPQRSGHSSSSELGLQPGSGLQTQQQPFLRSALLMSRRRNAMGTPLTLRTLAAMREGRNTMIFEHIRNALDLMRRGERLEDVLILDQSAFYGGADLHDRHRDMRLDIDNMSYEELLALEERIGNVSTGLSEETILKHLRQWKCLSVPVTSSGESEPCCICQEEYRAGEELGTLDCGHDFHIACVKQWLMQKNVCPICKMTALAT